MSLRPGLVLLLASTLLTPFNVSAQTKDDTLVYALQSDVQTWDPPTRCSARASSSATTSLTT